MSLSDLDLLNLRDWGTKIIRLGVMWEAVETAPGVYNQTYLNQIDDLINKIGEYGIYTMVDAH
jgi:endoglycosylceramidase